MDKENNFIAWLDNYAGNYYLRFAEINTVSEKRITFKHNSELWISPRSFIQIQGNTFIFLTKDEAIAMYKKYRQLNNKFKEASKNYKTKLLSLLER